MEDAAQVGPLRTTDLLPHSGILRCSPGVSRKSIAAQAQAARLIRKRNDFRFWVVESASAHAPSSYARADATRLEVYGRTTSGARRVRIHVCDRVWWMEGARCAPVAIERDAVQRVRPDALRAAVAACAARLADAPSRFCAAQRRSGRRRRRREARGQLVGWERLLAGEATPTLGVESARDLRRAG